MFYILLSIKSIFIFFTPILSIKIFFKKKNYNLNAIAIMAYFTWIILIILIIYYPFYSWYQKNEINAQHQISPDLFIPILFIISLLPFLYFFLILKTVNKKKIRFVINILALILLTCVTVIFIFVETYIYKVRLPFNEICYRQHNNNEVQLDCCLKAEYVWNEGFSYSDEVPKPCSKFINLNN